MKNKQNKFQWSLLKFKTQLQQNNEMYCYSCIDTFTQLFLTFSFNFICLILWLPWLQELLLLEQTKILAANIYEAFCQVDDTEDQQFAP